MRYPMSGRNTWPDSPSAATKPALVGLYPYLLSRVIRVIRVIKVIRVSKVIRVIRVTVSSVEVN